MYELVNTSLPNGLIAGTHGFATVAMTKGMPDVLRGRLESFCAYAHRTSVHDATYYQQNPVNWFHVTLPQGEHVVGCVAPSDFDYTGRTNRLARLRVFGAAEMPCVGGAEILARERHWFLKPWQGDPRYLDEDRNTCGHLRMLDPMRFSSAPAWEALFGSNGSRYAQQVAWQVERNLATGGKTVYFKTSAAWDVSGEKLLGLFGDVINLIPAETRSRVTFSTYPVSLPGGTGCSLRGIYDRDRFFDASSAVQAWVDCEHGRIIHAELLPTQGVKRVVDMIQSVNSEAEFASKSTAPGFVASISGPQINSRSARRAREMSAVQDLISCRRQGVDAFYVWLAIGILVFLIAAVIILYKFSGIANWRKDTRIEGANSVSEKPPARELPSNNDCEIEKTSPVQKKYEKTFSELVMLIDSEKPKKSDIEDLLRRLEYDSFGIKKRLNHDLVVDHARTILRFKEFKKNVNDIGKRPFDLEYNKKLAEIKKGIESERSKFESHRMEQDVRKLLDRIDEMLQEKDTEEKSKRKERAKEQEKTNEHRIADAYRSARNIYSRAALDKDKENFSTNNHCRVYYFNGAEKFANENAAYFKRKIGTVDSWSLKYGASYEKDAKDISKEATKIVLWYNEVGKTLYVQQITTSFQYTIGSTNDVVRLDDRMFGSEDMRKYYEESINGKVAYEVRIEGKNSATPALISEPSISVADINRGISENAARKIERKIKKLQGMITDFDKNKKPLEAQLSKLREADRAYANNQKRIGDIEARIGGRSNFGGKLKKDEKESLKVERQTLLAANQKILDDLKKDGLSVRRYEDIGKQISDINKRLNKKKMEEDLKKLENELSEIRSGKKDVGTIGPGMKMICTRVNGNDAVTESVEEQ